MLAFTSLRLVAPAALAALMCDAGAFGQARVLITEIMYNPNSVEDKGQTEWVEIANVGDQPIDIKDWRLDDEDQYDWAKFSCRLEPGDVAVLINADYVTEAQFREAWDAHEDASAAHEALTYQVIPVKWGGIANTPSAENEVLRLLNDKGEVVCEVKQEGEWPACNRPDGPSIYLTDLTATNLSDGRLWKRSEKNTALARNNAQTAIFNGTDIGSPGVVPGLSRATAPAQAPAASQPTTRPAGGNTIDY